MTDRFKGESEPIATNPILRGIDLAMDRLVRRDAFTERTITILDELRAEVLGVTTAEEVRSHYFEEAHTPINGSCWDQAPMVLPRPGECAPMPPLCELTAGHLGAHRSGTTDWMHSPTHTPEPQGEPSDAQAAEIEQRVYDAHRGQIAGMAKALVRAGWDAALRAAAEAERGENHG